MLHSCSNGQIPIKQVKVDGVLHDVPFTFQTHTGAVHTIEAIVNAPYILTELRVNNVVVQSPYTLIVTQPTNITIDVQATLNFQMSLANSEYIDLSTFEFDVLVRSFTEAFVITSYQVVMTYNSAWRNNQTMSIQYVNGSSELNNKPTNAVGWTDGKLHFASGTPNVDSIDNVEKRVGRFRMTVDSSYTFGIPVNLDWYFTSPLETIITGENITNITEFGSFLALPENHIVQVRVE